MEEFVWLFSFFVLSFLLCFWYCCIIRSLILFVSMNPFMPIPIQPRPDQIITMQTNMLQSNKNACMLERENPGAPAIQPSSHPSIMRGRE